MNKLKNSLLKKYKFFYIKKLYNKQNNLIAVTTINANKKLKATISINKCNK